MGGVGSVRWLLPLVLMLGVLGMHAVVALDAGHAGTAPTGSAHPSAAHATIVVDPGAAPDRPSPGTADHSGQHPAGDHALHLCLAVLGGLLVLLTGLTFLGRPPAPAPSTGSAGRGLRAPPRRPPTNAARLARLGVMRT